MSQLLVSADFVVFLYFLALNGFYALLLILAIPELWEHFHLSQHADLEHLIHADVLPPITIVAPCYNEGKTIEASVTAMLTLRYRAFEVIVVNDGSKDDTLECLKRGFDLYPVPITDAPKIKTEQVRSVYRSRYHSKLTVIDKVNGGKADALNAGINASRWPLVIAVDADTIIDPEALLKLGRPFLLGAEVAAVGATIRVANGSLVEDGRVLDPRAPTAILPGIQVVEYLRAFLYGRLGWNRLGGNILISGAFGLFRKDYLLAVGGYRRESIVEDLDLVIRLHRYLREKGVTYRMPFIPDPVAWTEVPESIRVLGRQRDRWQRGLIRAMWDYRTMLFNPLHGRIGMIGMPFYTFGEALSPVVEAFGYLATAVGVVFGAVNTRFAILFWVVAWGLGMLLSIAAIVLDEVSFRRYRRLQDLARLMLFAVIESFGYRQITVWFRLKAFASVWSRPHTWGEMTRRGFGADRSAAPQVPAP